MARERRGPPSRGTLWYRFVAWVAREVGFRALGGVRVLGRERVPPVGPVLVAPVHMSVLDPPLLGCTSPRALRFMAKEELFRIPVLAALIRSLGAFPVRRGENDTAAVRLALERLKSGEAVLVFPEGTRNDGRTMLPVQVGLAMLAKRTGAAVLPVGIAGTQDVLPRGRSRPRRAPMAVLYGEPFTYAEIAAGRDERAARSAFAAELARRIRAACAEAGNPIAPAPETG